MRLVLDANAVVSGLLWGGDSRRFIDAAIEGVVTLHSSRVLLDELANTLHYPRLAKRIGLLQTTPAALMRYYTEWVTLVTPVQVPRVVERDADDGQVLACALAANAALVITGDKRFDHLNGSYQNIRILKPAQAWVLLKAL